ncbi:hypothetical protein L0F63_000120 [Massospora cicadina]|nr:hypothetical protein L0F63_000120 [Massospora cicadina]
MRGAQCKKLDLQCHGVLCVTVLASHGVSEFGLDQDAQLCADFAAKFISSAGESNCPLSFGGLPYLHYPCLEGQVYESTPEAFLKRLKGFIILKCCLNTVKAPNRAVEALDFSWFLHLQNIIQANGMTLSTDHINELGAALYLVASMVNHSCNSNSKFKILEGGGVAIVARESSSLYKTDITLNETASLKAPIPETKLNYGGIKIGEEITISYHPVQDMHVSLRRKYLQDTYGFLCRCTRCQAENQLILRTPDLEVKDEHYGSKLEAVPQFFDLSTLFD